MPNGTPEEYTARTDIMNDIAQQMVVIRNYMMENGMPDPDGDTN